MTVTIPRRRRYVIIGTGHRAEMYIRSLLTDHADVAQLVGLCDINPARIDYYGELVASIGPDEPPLSRAHPDDLEAFIAANRVDRVIIAAPDFLHADFIVRALHAGADVVVEKPLTIDATSARRISDAIESTGRDVVVTFNYRYSPRNSALKQLVSNGAIGRVTSVNFEWVLDTAHGADYFRRWHREKANSGGLLVHKASHHFDLVNWWIDDYPSRVYASGQLSFYGDENADARGVGVRPYRGSTDEAVGDPFSLDLRSDERMRRLYLEAEQHDGYRRDRDVFSPGITIEDNLALVVDYAGGPILNYTLNAHSPWEGYRVAVNGTAGRAELTVVERSAVLRESGGATIVDPTAVHDGSGRNELRQQGAQLILQQHWQPAQEIVIPDGEGSHGGGDALLLADVFRGPAPDPLGRPAGYVDGLRSIAIGIAGNASIETGLPVDINTLDLGRQLASCDGKVAS